MTPPEILLARMDNALELAALALKHAEAAKAAVYLSEAQELTEKIREALR